MSHEHRQTALQRLWRSRSGDTSGAPPDAEPITLQEAQERAARRRWRLPALGTFLLAGALFVTTALSSGGLDLRESSVTDLDHVVLAERHHVNQQQDQVSTLTEQINDLTRSIKDTTVKQLQRKVAQLQGPAGFTAVHGPGVTVTLDDAPPSMVQRVEETGEIPRNALVIHQQDIQAVVNALWAGGAEAISIKGVRIISTTGIRCVGNTVILHGVPYSPPYTIRAIGSISDLEASLDDNDYVQGIIKGSVEYELGYDVAASADLEISAYTGSAALKYAERAPAPAERP
ncbi:MAG TPA: DUF881 domain-containing protein [Marmoricola sp.]|nr:DUF881 domain-containing protein [Marmoricola sp.]